MPKRQEKTKHRDNARFFTVLENALTLVDIYLTAYQQTQRDDARNEVVRVQEKFYLRLDELIKSGEMPEECTADALRKFYDFKQLDWTAQQNFNAVNNYFLSLKPEENTS